MVVLPNLGHVSLYDSCAPRCLAEAIQHRMGSFVVLTRIYQGRVAVLSVVILLFDSNDSFQIVVP